jgi:hypothetical protein
MNWYTIAKKKKKKKKKKDKKKNTNVLPLGDDEVYKIKDGVMVFQIQDGPAAMDSPMIAETEDDLKKQSD